MIFLGNTEDIGGVKVVTKILDDNIDMNTMREIGDNIKNKIPNAFVVLASKIGEKLILFLWLQKEAIDKGANAGAVISESAKQLGGGRRRKAGQCSGWRQEAGKNRGSYEKMFLIS